MPVDVINVNQMKQSTGRPDLMQLNIAVPSFNYNKQSGTDGSDAIDFASLRGLGFDQTLVLINGKRRHMSAFVNQSGTRGRGNSGTDLNAIPESEIDHIEILRDGSGVVPENFVFGGKFSTDVYFNYKLSKNIIWYAGVDNLFNVHPDESITKGARRNSWGDSESGGLFDAVQMGFNGIRLFTKFVFNFQRIPHREKPRTWGFFI